MRWREPEGDGAGLGIDGVARFNDLPFAHERRTRANAQRLLEVPVGQPGGDDLGVGRPDAAEGRRSFERGELEDA